MVFIKNVMKRLRVKDLTVGTILREISLAKNNMIEPFEFKALFETDQTMNQVADIYQAYDDEKSARLLLDFDDLLLETYRLLKENRRCGKIPGQLSVHPGGRVPGHKPRAVRDFAPADP